MKKRDTILDFVIFIAAFALGALVQHFCKLRLHFVWCGLITAVLIGGAFRLLLPYSSLSRAERGRRDTLCYTELSGAFKDSKKLRSALNKCVRKIHNGKIKKALKALDSLSERATEAEDKYAVSFWTGICCYRMRLYSDAIDEWNVCLTLRMDSIAASNLGLAYFKSYMFEKSEESYKLALELEPDNAAAIHGIALCHMATERYRSCIELCERGLRLDPRQYSFYEVLSLCYAALGERSKSYEYQSLLLSHDTYDGKKLLKTLDTIFENDVK